MEAHREGYAENLYLDSATRTNVEETGGANVLFVKGRHARGAEAHTDSILPSITRRSLVQVWRRYLGMTVEERYVTWEEVAGGEFAECGLCGTAAVISPVGLINDHGKEIRIPSGMDEMGPVLTKLYTTLRGIQQCEIEAPEDGSPDSVTENCAKAQ